VKRLLLAGYAAVLLLPLVLILGVVKPGAQGPVVIFADAVGFAALTLLALQVFVSGRWAATTRAFGLRAVLALHRQAGVAVVLLVLAHLALLSIDDPSRLALLDPLTAPPRARAGVLALLGLLAIAATSARRRRGSYERWRGLHLGLTAVVLAAGFAHVVWVDAYTSLPDVRWTVLGVVLAAAAGLFWTRVARPYSSTLRRYYVIAVRRERGDAVTVELAAKGHRGLRFQPGQFARLRAGRAVYGLDEHPFSLSSSALRPERPAFTVKALGDFSASLGRLRTGTELLVDGPHGEAAEDSRAVRGRLLLAAGIGITPALSVIRTAAERGDRRPIVLLYGSRRRQDATFAEELAALCRRLPSLRIVHVLSRPDPSWRGERGHVGEPLLRRYAPTDLRGWAALVCGPAAMVADSTAALERLGVTTIQAESFD
jgi:predicted ferric reductase